MGTRARNITDDLVGGSIPFDEIDTLIVGSFVLQDHRILRALGSVGETIDSFVREGGTLIFFAQAEQDSTSGVTMRPITTWVGDVRWSDSTLSEEKCRDKLYIRDPFHPLVSYPNALETDDLVWSGSSFILNRLGIGKEVVRAGNLRNLCMYHDHARYFDEFIPGKDDEFQALAYSHYEKGKVIVFAGSPEHLLSLYVKREARKSEVVSSLKFIENLVQFSSCDMAYYHTRREIGFADPPVIDGYHLLRADLHFHSTASDGMLAPTEVIEEEWRNGMDVVAITDHHVVTAYTEAKPVADKLGLLLLKGTEVSAGSYANSGHIVALGIEEDIDATAWPGYKERSLHEEVYREIERQGGYAILVHPPGSYEPASELGVHIGYAREVMYEGHIWAANNGLLHGVEVKNTGSANAHGTTKLFGEYFHPNAFVWHKRHNLAVFAGSDTHGRYCSAGGVMTLVFSTSKTVDGVFEALKDQRTVAHFAEMFWGDEEWLARIWHGSVSVTTTYKMPEEGVLEITFENATTFPFYVRLSLEGADLPAEHVVKLNDVGTTSVPIQVPVSNDTWTGVIMLTLMNFHTDVTDYYYERVPITLRKSADS